MRKVKGFTLIELLVVISIIALLIGILLPALGAARRTARQMQNTTQVRGIQNACVLYAQGNNRVYPGYDGSTQKAIAAGTGTTGSASLEGDTVQARFWIMLNNNYFTGDYAISPVETTKAVWTTGAVSTANYSYALSKVDQSGTSATTVDPADAGRMVEWQDNINTESIVVTDRDYRTTGAVPANDTTPQSVWTTSTGDWRGSVAWNDGHSEFLSNWKPNTKYNNSPTSGDSLFDDTTGSTNGGNPVAGSNALQVSAGSAALGQ